MTKRYYMIKGTPSALDGRAVSAQLVEKIYNAEPGKGGSIVGYVYTAGLTDASNWTIHMPDCVTLLEEVDE